MQSVLAKQRKEDVVQRILDLTEGQGVATAIEAREADITFQQAIKVTKAGGTISNIGYHNHGEFVHIPRIEWGVGMAEKTIKTGLCPVAVYACLASLSGANNDSRCSSAASVCEIR